MLYLHSLGHFHPPEVISNAFLESLDIGTDDAWIMRRVGIKNRHTVLPLDYIRTTRNQRPEAALEAAMFTNAQTGAKAGAMALERAGLRPSDIGLVLSGNCSTDECIPAEANRVAEAMNIDAPALEVATACSSFGSQLYFIEGMKPERLPDYVLLVCPENNTKVVDFTDRNTCILWGDASAAAVVSPRIPSPWVVEHAILRGQPAGAQSVRTPRFGHFSQQGSEVQKFAIRRTEELFKDLCAAWLRDNAEHSKDNLRFVGHQANLRMLELVTERCQLSEKNHLFNVDRRGNVGAAGAPSVLSERWNDQEALGKAIALCVVGSGLTWSGVLLNRTT